MDQLTVQNRQWAVLLLHNTWTNWQSKTDSEPYCYCTLHGPTDSPKQTVSRIATAHYMDQLTVQNTCHEKNLPDFTFTLPVLIHGMIVSTLYHTGNDSVHTVPYTEWECPHCTIHGMTVSTLYHKRDNSVHTVPYTEWQCPHCTIHGITVSTLYRLKLTCTTVKDLVIKHLLWIGSACNVDTRKPNTLQAANTIFSS